MTVTQLYNEIVNNIALKRHGIKAEAIEELTHIDWEVLFQYNSDKEFVRLCVYGYFDGVGSEYIEANYH